MVWRFLKKLGIKPPYDPAIPLLGIYSEKTKIEKDTCIPFFIAALFTIARTWKQPRCSSTDEWIKNCGTYTQWNIQFSSVAQSCLTLCDPMNSSTPGLPVHHQLPEFTQTHIHRVSAAIQPSHPLSSPSPPAPNPSQHRSFPMSQLFSSGGQSIGALASVLPMNSQGWFLLGLTGLILQSKGCSRVFSSTTVWKHQFFSAQQYLCSRCHIHKWLLDKP